METPIVADLTQGCVGKRAGVKSGTGRGRRGAGCGERGRAGHGGRGKAGIKGGVGRGGRGGARVNEEAGHGGRGKARLEGGAGCGGRGAAHAGRRGAGRGVERSRRERTAKSDLETIRQNAVTRLTTKRAFTRLPAEYQDQTKQAEPVLLPDTPPRKRARRGLDTQGTLAQSPDPHNVVASARPLMCDWTTCGLRQDGTTDFLVRSSAYSGASSPASIPESTAPTSSPTVPKIAGNLLARKDSAPQLQQSTPLAPAFSSAPSPNLNLQAALASNNTRTVVEWFELLNESEDANAASDIDVVADCGILDAEPAHLPEHLNTDLIDLIETEDIANDRLLTGLLADTDNVTFNWTNDSESFLGQRENFVGPSGPTFPLEKTDRPLDVFLKYFDSDVLDLLVLETNKNIHSLTLKTFSQHSRFQGLKKTSRSEIAIFLAMLILQGNHPLSVEKEYFQDNGFLTLKYFKTLMPYRRFLMLKNLLHYTGVPQLTNDNDKLLEPFLNLLCSKFKELYFPSRDIAIDESLLKWHGRLGFAQKIATKAAKVGIKTYELCESSSGYCWSFFVYTGKGHNQVHTDRQHIHSTDETGTQEMGRQIEQDDGVTTPTNLTAQIVLDLVRPLFNRGHALAMNNFFNSPLLARYLKRNGVDCFGTLRINREFVPEAIKSMSKTALRPGEVVQSYCHDLSVTMWRDSNLVALLSTFHGGEADGKETHGHYKYKPQVVFDYNLSMGGLGKKDRLLSAHPIENIGNRDCYKQVFRRVLNVTILNAYIVYKTQNPRMPQRAFRTTLAEEMIAMFKPEIQRPLDDHIVRETTVIKRGKLQRPILKGNHFLGPGRSKYLKCVYCRNARTSFICKQCEVGLCLKICFEAFHTVP